MSELIRAKGAPRRRVVGEGIDNHGEPLDILDCGHAVAAILASDLPRVPFPSRRCLECAQLRLSGSERNGGRDA